MLRLNYLFLLIITASFIHAQSPSSVLTGTLTRENTNIKYFTAKVWPWEMLSSGSRFTFAAGAGGRLYLNGLYINADYTYHYVDALAKSGSIISGNSIYEPTNSRDGDASIGYFFQKKTRGKVHVRIGRSLSAGHSNTDHYATVIANYNKLFGFQMGYKQGFCNLTIPQGIIVRDAYIQPDHDIITTQGLNTYMEYGWYSFGATYGKIIDVAVDLEKYGHIDAHYMSRFYANILLAKYSKLEDVYYKDYNNYKHTVNHLYVLDGHVKMSNIGFNIGWERTNIKKLGTTYGVELGTIPGVKVSQAGNFYFTLKAKLTLSKFFKEK